MNWLARWIKTTFDYNPTFPLSALVLLGGLRLLAAEGLLDGSTVAGAGGAVGILSSYELLLLGVSLLVLWPRRIAYETTSILIIFAVVRFAAPFAVIGLAAEGHPAAALLMGLGLTVLMVGKGEALYRKLDLDLQGWERAADYALFGLACLGFPLVAERLSVWTGDALSHSGARLLQLAMWWTLSLALTPLCLGLRDLGREGPLRSRRPALVWRWLTAVASAALLFSALWLGGSGPFLLALLPLALLGAALFRTSLEAAGLPLPSWLVHLPAAAFGAVVLLPIGFLVGGLPVLSHPAAVLITLPLAGAFSLVLAGPGERLRSLRSLGALVALAPLRFAPSATHAECYLLALAGGLLVLGLARRRDGLSAAAALAAAALAAHLLWLIGGADLALQGVLGGGSLFALAAGWRIPPREEPGAFPASLAAATTLCMLPATGLLLSDVSGRAALLAMASGLALVFLGRAQRAPALIKTGGLQALAVGGQRCMTLLAPGAALVLLGFLAIPAGTAIALRRERRDRFEAARAQRARPERIAA